MSSREMQKRLKELAAALKAEPGSIPRRLELAAALKEANRLTDAIDLYRGVAAVYAEEGRLVQAMAVCKGILEMDPEHRDTLEMLATLAQRSRAARRSSTELRQVDGKWVAEPKRPSSAPPPPLDAHTPPSVNIGHFSPVSPRELTPAEASPWQRQSSSVTRAGDEPDATRVGTEEEVPHDVRSALYALTPPEGVPAYDSISLAEAPPGDTDTEMSAAPPVRKDTMPSQPALDFDDATKSRARGNKLLALPEDEKPKGKVGPYNTVRMANLSDEEIDARDTLGHGADVPEPLGRHDTPVHGFQTSEDLPRTTSDEETKAAVRPAIDSGRQRSQEHQLEPELYGPEETTNTIIQDAVSAPFPRPMLQVEPPPFPLLSDLPRPAFMELLARLEDLKLDAGTTVLREGDMGDACYLIASGAVRVTKNGVEVAVLGPGSFFGEFAVLADQRRHASVITIEPVELLEIKRQLLDELVAAHPGVARTLRKFYRERLLATLMATAPFFERLQPTERASIAERFRPRRFGRGARIIEEGSPGGGLFLILVGEVEVVRGPAEAEVALGKLGEGSYFGEMSLLRGGTASATVRATRMTEVVQLPPRDFYEVVSQHPVLWEQLRSEAEKREMANHAIVAGEARKSDDGTIYLV
jgi:CRP-like cAMP-binding protein